MIEHREPRRYFRDLETAGRWFRYETLLLPLSRDGTTIDMIVSAISVHDLQIPLEPNQEA